MAAIRTVPDRPMPASGNWNGRPEPLKSNKTLENKPFWPFNSSDLADRSGFKNLLTKS
jgi:hypothetical protein